MSQVTTTQTSTTIPQSMQDRTQWLLWNLDNDTDKNGVTTKKKVPYTVTGPHVHKAGSTNLKHYRTYRQVCAYLEQYKDRLTGIGFALANGITGIDLDGCRDAATGVIADWAMTVIQQLNSYTEISPSGTGVHIFCLGTVIEGKNKRLPELNKRAGIEMYSDGKYFTVSGNHLEGTLLEVMARQDDLDAVYAQYMVQTPTQTTSKPLACPSNPMLPIVLSDDDLIRIGKSRPKMRDRFTALWNGDISAYGNDSVADLALCGDLAYLTGKDASRMDSLFRQSRLMRDKWDERRGDSTWGYKYNIEPAIAGCNEVYTPKNNQRLRLVSLDSDYETPQAISTEPADFKSELGNSQRFINQYGDKVRYVYTAKKWMYYDGTRWLFDATGQVRRWAKACVISLLSDAANCETDNERKAMVKHAMTSQSHKAISGMLALAESERPLQPDELDTNHWLLNLKNGTFNLETNTLQPHNRLDYISRIANVTYDPQAAAPQWDNFVHWAMCKDNDLEGYLQRAIGYGATGLIREQAMFIAYGTGANGKSTFFSIIQGILGDYAQGIQSESIMIQKATGGANNDIASLRSSRFVVTNEGEDGSRLAESLIKKITGGDVVRARFLYGENFEFNATHKLFFTTNHKPQIRGTDNGIWRRMKMIPFANTLKIQEQDTHLPDKLARESSGILNWIIEGCHQWRLNGLGTCETVDDATKGYRNEMDIIAGFIDDCCITTRRDAQVKSSEIYTAYVAWCEANGERATSQKKFGMSLIERGFTQRKGGAGVRLWDGIGLLETSGSVAHVAHVDHFPKVFLHEEELGKVYGNTPKRATCATDDTTSPVDVPAAAAVSSVHNESPNTPCLHCGKIDYHWLYQFKLSPNVNGAWSCNRCYTVVGLEQLPAKHPKE